jgi:hypothetical protein
MKVRLIFMLVCACLVAVWLGDAGLDSWFDGR